METIMQTTLEQNRQLTYNVSSTNNSVGSITRPTAELAVTSEYADAYVAVIKIQEYLLPCICAIGLIGNTLSTITFLRKPLRKSPCSLYLAARGISDNGFLLSLLLIWTSSVLDLKLSHVKGVCQLIIFMTYNCGFYSVWLCVFITFENFMMIYKPFVARRICDNRTAKLSILVLVITATGIYNTSLWIVNADCSHNPVYTSVTQILVYSDTLLTLVIPTVIIFVLLSVIIVRILKILHVRKLHSDLMVKLTKQRPAKPVMPISKVTKMLLIVSVTFFVLNVPSHAIRLTLLIGTYMKGHNTMPYFQATIQTIFQLVYYLSFSVNIFVYCIFGSNFRRTFVNTFCFRVPKSHIYVPTEAVNRVRHRGHTSFHIWYNRRC